ncbi:unnamed protein product [Penicillium pancosmium]
MFSNTRYDHHEAAAMTCKPHIAAIECAENIALNYLLHEVPEPPQQKPTVLSRGFENDYLIPFSKEMELVEILSFLAKTKEGSDYIPAMCVEQDPSGPTLKALLAINKRKYTDGNHLLQNLKTGFEMIFNVLRKSRFERGSSTEITKKLLQMIVQMCSARITCRLRLTGKKWKESKRSIKDHLERAMEGVRQINPQKLIQFNLDASSLLFRTESKSVIQSINKWSNHKVLSFLDDIVEKMYRLNNIIGLQQLLHLIPSGPTKMVKEATFASSLLNIIQKVSRYKEAARIIHRIAKKFPLVRNIEVHLASLPPEAFDRPHHSSYLASLSATLSRLGKINGKQYDTSQFSQFIKGKTTESLGEEFSQQTARTLQEAKIHAEIQIIAYCEIQSPPLFPRAIASSKDACFLCYAFIQSHNKMHTSRKHGRLYPGWRLPTLSSLKMLEHKFNEVLLDHARQTIRARAKGQIDIHPHPNESTLLPMLASMSTTGAIPDQTSIIEKTALPHVVPPGLRTLKNAISTAGMYLKFKEASSCALASSDPIAGTISPRFSSPFFLTGPLHIQLEMEGSLDPESATKSFTYCIAKLSVNQSNELPIETLMVDVVKLEGEITYALPPDGRFCIQAHDVRVKITCQ